MSFTLRRSFYAAVAKRSYGTVQSPSAASLLDGGPSRSSTLLERVTTAAPSTTWAREDVEAIYHTPLSQLTYTAATRMSPVDEVLKAARIAKGNGSTRFCMGAAWRDMRGRKTSLKNVKQMVSGI
ncbi:hypothetical protein KEM56_003319, partial [Ascosphaera pollenicola]